MTRRSAPLAVMMLVQLLISGRSTWLGWAFASHANGPGEEYFAGLGMWCGVIGLASAFALFRWAQRAHAFTRTAYSLRVAISVFMTAACVVTSQFVFP